MKYWKIYTGVYIVILAAAVLSKLLRGDGVDIFGAFVTWGSAIALVGLVLQKPFLRQCVWKAVAVICALTLMLFPLAGAYIAISSSENETLEVTILLVMALLLLPAAYGTYLYGFKCNYLWKTQSN